VAELWGAPAAVRVEGRANGSVHAKGRGRAIYTGACAGQSRIAPRIGGGCRALARAPPAETLVQGASAVPAAFAACGGPASTARRRAFVRG